jgi:hypothetical protein
MTERELIRLIIERCHEQNPPLLVFRIPGSRRLDGDPGTAVEGRDRNPAPGHADGRECGSRAWSSASRPKARKCAGGGPPALMS